MSFGCLYSEENGITIANSVSFINRKQAKYSYAAQYFITKTQFDTALYNAITSKAPPIVSLSMRPAYGWYYNADAHAVTLYSVMSDKSQYALADPAATILGHDEWRWYDKTSNQLYNAYFSSHGLMA